MRFANPELLIWLLAVPVLMLLSALTYQRRKSALIRFAGGKEYLERFTAEVSPSRRLGKLLLIYLAVTLAVLALARPQWGTRQEQVERAGSDVVVIIDHSLSMAAEDVAPSRLQLAIRQIGQLTQRLAGDRIGLVRVAGDASVACPLTIDHGAVQLFLEALDSQSAPVQGTALSQAIEIALSAFDATDGQQAEISEEPRGRAIVLYTDGEDHEGGLEEALAQLEEAGVRVFAMGMGTQRGGPIPLENGGYKKDREDRIVTTRLDEVLLQEVARVTQGQYHRVTARGAELDRVVDAIQGLEKGSLGATLRTRYEERFQWPLAGVLLALLLEAFLGEKKRNRMKSLENGESR